MIKNFDPLYIVVYKYAIENTTRMEEVDYMRMKRFAKHPDVEILSLWRINGTYDPDKNKSDVSLLELDVQDYR